MNRDKIYKLKELLSIPTKTWQEEEIMGYLRNHCKEKGYSYKQDKNGSLYITKGKTKYFPCVVAHTDTVHEKVNMVVNEEFLPNAQGESKLALKAYRKDNGLPTGIGGDDKAGVFICLELLEKIENLKVFFPIAEETGCHGSKEADKKFFKDVGYAIQFDSTENDTMSLSLMGVKLFDEKSKFFTSVKDTIVEHGFINWHQHPYTDTMMLKKKFNFPCLNFAAGYYNYHTSEEYVVIEDVENAINLGEKVIKILGNKKYKYKSTENKWVDHAFGLIN